MDKKTFLTNLNRDLKSQGLSVDMTTTEQIYNTFINALSHEITEGRTVKLSGFGTWSSTQKEYRKDLRDKNSPKIKLFAIQFKPSDVLKNLINGKFKDSQQ